MKQMVITVGTSLFSSATWQPREGDFEETGGLPSRIPGYGVWLDCCLKSPADRAGDHATSDFLRKTLTQDNGELWARCLPEGLADGAPGIEPKRFSAELTTLLRLVKRTAADQGREVLTLRKLLDSYDEIHVVTEARPRDADERCACAAAAHLRAYLDRLSRTKVTLREFKGLASHDDHRLTDGLCALRDFVHERVCGDRDLALDLVLTGGFKVYGYLLSPLGNARDNVRLIYGHETASSVVVISGGQIQVGQAPKIGTAHDEGFGR